MQPAIIVQSMESIFTRFLVTLLLGVTFSAAAFLAVDDDHAIKKRRTIVGTSFIQKDKFEFHLILLAPFQQLALEIHFLLGQPLYVEQMSQYAIIHETPAIGIAAVKVDCTDKCLESIASQVAVVRMRAFMVLHEFVKAYLHSKSPESLALHYLAARIGQETLSLAWETVKYRFAYNSIKHRIAEKLQSLVVYQLATLLACSHRFVQQCLMIKTDIARIETQHITKSAIKRLFLAEWQPYRVYHISGRHHGLTQRIS